MPNLFLDNGAHMGVNEANKLTFHLWNYYEYAAGLSDSEKTKNL
ncbi:MAG: hypothetical protein WCN27_04595 [Alphaproteobacteria bacterium]